MVQTSMEHILQKSAEARLTETVDYDVIILATARFDGKYSSTSYSLSQALSKHTRVFYLDNPFTVKNFLKNKDTALKDGDEISIIPAIAGG